MASPTEWAERLDLSVNMKARKKTVLGEIAGLLAAHPGAKFTTTELVEQLYPEWMARGDGIFVRQRLFAAVLALADDDAAKPYAARQEARPGKFGKAIRPVVWSAPRKAATPQRWFVYPDTGPMKTPKGDWVLWNDVKEFFE